MRSAEEAGEEREVSQEATCGPQDPGGGGWGRKPPQDSAQAGHMDIDRLLAVPSQGPPLSLETLNL